MKSKHTVKPIGLRMTQKYLELNEQSRRQGRTISEENKLVLTLVLAYGASIQLASRAVITGYNGKSFSSPTHKTKQSAIPQIAMLVENGTLSYLDFNAKMDPDDIKEVWASLSMMHEPDQQEMAAVEIVTCLGAPAEEVAEITGIDVSRLKKLTDSAIDLWSAICQCH